MKLVRLIAPDWTKLKPKVIEGMLTDEQIQFHNQKGYNAYYFPNAPKEYIKTEEALQGTDINDFKYVFVDMDLKEGKYKSKNDFLESLVIIPEPSQIVDSGNGIHVYWYVMNLDAMSFLRFQRRLCRFLNTDENVGKLLQLMRLPNTLNTKKPDVQPLCEEIFYADNVYTAEDLDKALPAITLEDEEYCQNHYNKTHSLNQENYKLTEVMPAKWGQLLRENSEVKQLWSGNSVDRSKDDFRLGHLLFANDFTKEEAVTVLSNSAKASQRAPTHRLNYALNIVEKIWTYEEADDKQSVNLSPTVRDILAKGEETLKGTRFPCNRLIDDTHHGFRLGQVIGIIGGSGVGKTTLTLNTFLWFAENNPDYHHFFFSLEQPAGEIANRVRLICQGNEALYDRIHIISNYDQSGNYIHYSMEDIEKHLLEFQETTGFKVGATVIDHIGVLDKQNKNGENEGLIGVCREMKAMAVKVNTMLIMLSQAPREKSGIGDLELDKNAAYGTVFFESFCDYCICLWQPLKRVYTQGAPTVMAIKFAKIRHKNQKLDVIKEDICYQFFFDPETERLRELTQDEEKSSNYWLKNATNARKADRKTDIVKYESRRTESKDERRTDSH